MPAPPKEIQLYKIQVLLEVALDDLTQRKLSVSATLIRALKNAHNIVLDLTAE